MRAEIQAATQVHTTVGPPTPGKVERRREEVRRLEKVGRSPESSPTRQLAQMATDVGPSSSTGEDPVQKKLWTTVGGKAPRKEFLKAGLLKRFWKYWPGIVALSEICQFQKSTELFIHKYPFSQLVCEIAQEVGKYDICFQVSS